MRTTKKICFVLLAAILTGCSTTPKVIADVVEQLPSQPAEKVVVYNTDERVPRGAKPIGKVNVTDGGMTPAYAGAYVAKMALRQHSKPLVALGLSYKGAAVLAKLLPRRLSNWIVGLIYAK